MAGYPFTAIVGADDMALALILTAVAPDVGGVLVRGEKGTAKSTMVRALVEVLPEQRVVAGCRFGCDPEQPYSQCPDGPHGMDSKSTLRAARLVELPVGATEDRVIGALDLGKVLSSGKVDFEPGLLATANRGILYVDEVNLLHDHLVDLLLDAAAMGQNTVERDGISVTHQAQISLVGTMNPEEGELRPQLLDRFGLTVEIAASRDPKARAEVVRRRLAFDANQESFATGYSDDQAALHERIVITRTLLSSVELTDTALDTIARVCAGFEVDGMRADIITARAARAHAAWEGRTQVTRADIRAAARLALPHRRRRNPFDAPGLDEDLLDRLLGEDEPSPPDDTDPQGPPPVDALHSGDDAASVEHDETRDQPSPDQSDGTPAHSEPDAELPAPAPTGVASINTPFRVRDFTVRGVGRGEAGRRSRAITDSGRTIRAATQRPGPLHLPATVTAAAVRRARGDSDATRFTKADLRTAVREGHESNLILLAVDASGSMGARRRMEEVKTAVLSLLTDAYQRRDRVGLVTFRGHQAELTLPPTSSIEAAAACLQNMPHGGRTPLAEGLITAAHTLRIERIRDPRRRPLLVLLTDGRATSGLDALQRARTIADRWPSTHVQSVVVDCETGMFRMGLAADLSERMGADYVALSNVAATALVDIVRAWRPESTYHRGAA